MLRKSVFERLLKVIKSTFALPVWVIIWMAVFLIPANLSGYFLLQYESGWWVAVLGGTALLVNTVIVLINGGMSKVLAIPHLVFWLPLQFILADRLASSDNLTGFEHGYLVTILVINGISLGFDFYDTREWWRGNRKIAGFEDQAPVL